MTDAEARYYHASRAARQAWERTQPQLQLPLDSGLDGHHVATGAIRRRPTAPRGKGQQRMVSVEPVVPRAEPSPLRLVPCGETTGSHRKPAPAAPN